jgi:sugar lactone lactonase YvrE
MAKPGPHGKDKQRCGARVRHRHGFCRKWPVPGKSRIQIFDQEGRYLTEWKQFGRPSGVYIDKNDNMYVSDSTSTEKTNPGFGQGIRVGSAKDGKVTAYIPETKELSALEGIAADDAGNIYGGYTNTLNFTKGSVLSG